MPEELYKRMNPYRTVNKDLTKDYSLDYQKYKYSKPSFSPYPDSWEMDTMFLKTQSSYMFFININTRYLYCIQVKKRDIPNTYATIKDFISREKRLFGHEVRSIRSDADWAYINVMNRIKDVDHYYDSNKFTNRNRIVDRVMRTMRDLVDNLYPNEPAVWNGLNDNIIQMVVNYYNNHVHKSIGMTPLEMHTNRSAEWEYIRKKTNELNEVKQIISANIQPGDIVQVAIDATKTKDGFTKRRRQFNSQGIFLGYKHGNALVKITSTPFPTLWNKEIVLPLYAIHPI